MKFLVSDNESMETIEVLFQKCQKVKIISSFDLVSSFWQIPLHPDSRKYTAFQHEGRCYEFKVTPFGLKTSTAALVRGLDLVLQNDKRNVINFIDDILCISSTFEEHLLNLESLFKRLQENNMTLNFGKSEFCKEEVTFLGHIVNKTEFNQIH
jgi:Reverse transcriptase (RNA-dependent DNA polymerase).